MTFLRNCWYVAGYPHEVSRKPIFRSFLDEPVLMYRKEDGELVAMDNRCAHRLAPLNAGQLIGDNIQCPYHGLQYDPAGACVKLPIGGLVPPRAKLRVYPIAERHGLLWIWMGDPVYADIREIADFSYLLDDAYGWFDGYLHAEANYQLLVDNLLDLTHTEFLHPLLKSEGYNARHEQQIEQSGDTITIHNIAVDDNILPLMAQLKPRMGKVGRSVQTITWNPPSLLHLSIEYYSGDDDFIIPSGHFLTPETKFSTHYFTRGGQAIDPGNADFTEGMKQGVLHIFGTEDIPMIEAQQKHLGDADLMIHDPAILRTDAGPTRARRWLAKRIRQESDVQASVPAFA